MDQENRLVRTGRTYKEASSRFLSLSKTIKGGLSSFLSFCGSDGVAQPLKDILACQETKSSIIVVAEGVLRSISNVFLEVWN